MGFDYIGVGTPTFGGPASAPTQFFDKGGRVLYVWDGQSGRWIPSPGTNSTLDGVTAAGTTQATATVIANTPTAINVTTTPASSGILLPPSWTGAEIAVNNVPAVALKIYPFGTETINGGGAGVAFTTAVGPVLTILYCFTQGAWWVK